MTLRQAAQITDGQVRYLLHATITDSTSASLPSTPAVDVDLYFGNIFYMDRASTSSAFYYKPFEPRLITPLNITLSMFEPGKSGGVIRVSGGTISLANADGELDYLLDYSWDKKPITLYMLRGIADDDVFSDHYTIWGGYTLGVSASTSTIDIVVGDRLAALDKDFPPNIDSTTGSPIPITLGKVYSVPPLLVDSSTDTYQVHDGAVTSIDAVYQGGESLTLTTDYTVDAANGKFTLTSPATGIITADVTNNITFSSYTNGAGLLILELLTTYAGLSTAGNVDVIPSAFRISTTNAYEHGIFFDGRDTILDAVNFLAQSVGAIVYPTTSGNLSMSIPEFPTASPLLADPITDAEILDIEMLATERFSGVNVRVKYKKNHRVLSQDELSATPDDIDFSIREWRSYSLGLTSTTWGAGYNSLRDIDIDTSITNLTDATTEANRLSNYYLRDAKVFRVRMKTNPLYLEVGGSVELKSSRFGLTDGSGNGYPMLILSKFDDLEANEVTLELMGETT